MTAESGPQMDGAVFAAIRHILGVRNHELAELLPRSQRTGEAVGTRTLRAWAAGDEPVPPHIAEAMWRLFTAHTDDVDQAMRLGEPWQPEWFKDGERFDVPVRYEGFRDGRPHGWWVGVAARLILANPSYDIRWESGRDRIRW